MKKLEQINWDTALLTCFYLDPSKNMCKFLDELHEKFDFSYESLKILLRTPRNKDRYSCTVCGFICIYLPMQMSNTLWENAILDLPRLLKKIPNKFDTLSDKKRNFKKETRELNNVKQSARRYFSKIVNEKKAAVAHLEAVRGKPGGGGKLYTLIYKK